MHTINSAGTNKVNMQITGKVQETVLLRKDEMMFNKETILDR